MKTYWIFWKRKISIDGCSEYQGESIKDALERNNLPASYCLQHEIDFYVEM